MRKLPSKRSPRQKLLIQITFDFYGDGLRKREYRKAKEIALYLMGRRKGIKLDEEQEESMWHVRGNLSDKTYITSFSLSVQKIRQDSHQTAQSYI